VMTGTVGGASAARGTAEMADTLLEIRLMTPERLAEIRDAARQRDETVKRLEEATAKHDASREAAEKAAAAAIAEREAADRTIRLMAREKMALADDKARFKQEQEHEAKVRAERDALHRRHQTRIERAAHDALAALAEAG